MGDPLPNPKRYLLCFVPEDRDGKAELKAHLEVSGTRTVWSVEEVSAGVSRRDEFERAATGAEAALLLLSADFFAALGAPDAAEPHGLPLAQQIELLVQQQKERGLRLIPVVWRYCDWQEVPWLAKLQALPVSRSPIKAMDAARRDEAFTAIARRLSEPRAQVTPGPAEVPVTRPLVRTFLWTLMLALVLALAIGVVRLLEGTPDHPVMPASQGASASLGAQASVAAAIPDQATAPTIWRVEGLVRDRHNEPLAGVTVALPEQNLTTLTNEHGHFGFAVVAEQNELVLLRAELRAAPGGKRRYEPQEIHVSLGSTKLSLVLDDSR